MDPIEWSDFPLPLIQVNPPAIAATNNILSVAYKNGVFSNSAEIHRKASSEMSKLFNGDLEGYLASSNTTGLTSCLLAVGIRGRHVLISNFTFAATLDAVVLAGGIPIVCDIDPESLVLDIEKVANALKNKDYDIAVVLPTRVFGFINNLSKLIAECNVYNVPVIVDAAASLPSRRNSWNFELYALYEVFSLHATKVFGIGEGGLVIGSPELIEQIRERSNFGLTSDGSLKFKDGINAKADEFTSARALARLQEYSMDVGRRQEFVKLYKGAFGADSRVRMIEDNSETVYSYFPIIFESEKQLLDFQKAISPFIMSRRYYFPTIQSGYIGDAPILFDADLRNSESIAKRILCLPVYVSCGDDVKNELRILISMALGEIS
jgi:dTDP-4-amino-4,6-dideoxygalactose transaminase